jgi:hypothetical protein
MLLKWELIISMCMADLHAGICPSGKSWADKAQDTDSAHTEVECSNNGMCNRHTVSIKYYCLFWQGPMNMWIIFWQIG